MKTHERIKYLRKEVLRLTQQEFSEAINLSRSNMGNIEIGRIAVTDRVISDICNRYSVNEEWLRTGKGDMFKPMTRSETISKFAGELMHEEDDSFKKRLIEAMASLTEEQWEVLESIAKALTSKKD